MQSCNSFRLAETVSRFPNLKKLYVNCKFYDGIATAISPLAIQQGRQEVSNLEYLNLSSYVIESEDDLAMVLFDVLPLFPKLTKFSVGWHKIKSFLNIAQRISDNDLSRVTPGSRIRRLHFGVFKPDEPVVQFIHDPIEVEAMKTILSAFKELYAISGLESLIAEQRDLDSHVDYLIRINCAGRVLIEKKEDGTSTNPDIPLSVWPFVLERAWKRYSFREGRLSDYDICPEGIYYLLQNIQALREGSKRQSKNYVISI